MKVRIERASNRILLHSDRPVALKDAIPGSYFRKDKLWSLPLDLTTCHLLRERFGARLEIGPALTEWARAEKASRRTAEAVVAAGDATLQLLPKVAARLAEGMESRTYQRSGVRFMTDAIGRDGRRSALNGDTVGLGKTAQAIGAALESGQDGPYLIVAPKTAAKLTWAKEIQKWLGADADVYTLPDGAKARQDILSDLAEAHRHSPSSLARTWLIVHPYIVRTQTWWECAPCHSRTKFRAGMVQELDCGHPKDRTTAQVDESVHPEIFAMEYGAVICDESDQILIRLKGTPNLQRRGMELLRDRVRPGGCRFALSGTPFRSKPHQIWSTLNWLDPVRFGAKWRWLEQYWDVTKGGYGGSYTIGKIRPERQGLLDDELRDIMIRRTREEVRGDLPPKLYPSNVAEDGSDGLTRGIYLPMSKAQEKAYREMESMGSVMIDGARGEALGVLAEMTRLKQFAGAEMYLEGGDWHFRAAGGKYEWLLEFLTSLGLPDRPASKVVIASQFTRLLNAFADGIEKDLKLPAGERWAAITGEVTGDRRLLAVDRFEDPKDPLDLLWINTKAGGSSITLDAADVMIVLDETWVDDEQQQLEGRIDNRNPERKIAPRSYYYLRSLGTMEEAIAAANAEARALGGSILDGASIARRAKEFVTR